MKNSTLLFGALALIGGIGLGAATLTKGQHPAESRPLYSAPDTSVTVKPIENLKYSTDNSLHTIDDSLSRLAAYAMPAVVKIESERNLPDMMGGRTRKAIGTGSGFIFRPDGYIITNDHVVDGATTVHVTLHDGRELTGTVTHGGETDVALVKIEAKDLPTLPLADSKRVRAGQLAMAIGSPFQFDGSVTIGHISAVKRSITFGGNNVQLEPEKDRVYPDLVQTDAAVNTGNSGGPLINVDGEVVGVNTLINSESGGSNGVGFAISSNQVKFISDLLLQGKKVARGFMGLSLVDLPEYKAKELGIAGGSIVKKAPSDSQGAIAGIKEEDVIVKIGDQKIESYADVLDAMYSNGPGAKVNIQVLRDKATKSFEVKLGNVPERKKMMMPMGDFDQNDTPKFNMTPDKDDTPSPSDGPVKFDSTPRLGVTLNESDKGPVVMDVQTGSVARKLGIRNGDYITKFDSINVKSIRDLTEALQSLKKGQHVVQWMRTSEGANTVFSKSVDY